MKFDLLVEKLLTENSEEKSKKLYKVSCYKYGISKETTASSPEQAISFVAVRYAKDKGLKSNAYGRIIKDFKSCAKAKLVEEGFELEKKEGLRGWFKRNKGKGWIDCKKSRKGKLVPCGRKKGTKSGKGYPACRPTLSMCSGSKRKKKSSKRITWKKNK